MKRSTFEEIESLCAEIRHLQQRLASLLGQQGIEAQGIEIEHAIEQVLTDAREKVEQDIQLALQRLNLRDDGYRFLRAIDGDTIEVEPPGELREWMRDVHVRLYGIDAPERGEEKAQFYTDLLKGLCNLDKGRLSIVWERERRGTEYAGFPLSSFERGIGNVFVGVPESDDQVLYVSAFLASFPDISLIRNDKPLLRGSRVLRSATFEHWPHWRHWPWHPIWWRHYRELEHDFAKDPDMMIKAFAQEAAGHYPWSIPWLFPRKVLLDPSAQVTFLTHDVRDKLMQCGCRGCHEVARFLESELPAYVEGEKVSAYDVLLVLAKGSCP